jgi:hypothetical protein
MLIVTKVLEYVAMGPNSDDKLPRFEFLLRCLQDVGLQESYLISVFSSSKWV